MQSDAPKRDAVQWKTPLDRIHGSCLSCGHPLSGMSVEAAEEASLDHHLATICPTPPRPKREIQ